MSGQLFVYILITARQLTPVVYKMAQSCMSWGQQLAFGLLGGPAAVDDPFTLSLFRPEVVDPEALFGLKSSPVLSVDLFLVLLKENPAPLLSLCSASASKGSLEIKSILAIPSSMACKQNRYCSQVWMSPHRIDLIRSKESVIWVLVMGFLVCFIKDRQESARMKVPDRPTPAEQWTTLGDSAEDGCLEVTM